MVTHAIVFASEAKQSRVAQKLDSFASLAKAKYFIVFALWY
jgi:hypothetical protein